VRVAVAVGLADRRLGQAPAVAVELAPGAAPPSFAELEAHLRRRAPATHVPVAWRIVAELPRTPSFKIDRRAVAQLFESEPAGG
jgi:fatty-acyl-CoA synthase